uniref:Tripartite motif-containing 33 n=2 Tax=Nothobranchius korthausae TaxID=1143690 RepID=A0A1A8GNS5_9TELE
MFNPHIHHQQQQQQQQIQQQQIQQQMRIASQLSQQHPRQAGPPIVQQQPPRLISMQQLQRGPGGMNGGPNPSMYPSSHHMRLPGPSQGRMPTAQPRLNGQQYSPMMQPQLQRQMSIESEMSHQRFRFLLQSGHSNPGHAGPFPVASLHNASPTSPTSASMAGSHAHRGPTSPIIGPIELIPSVTNPEKLPCLPEIPPIQLEDAGSTSLGNLLSRYISASTHQLVSLDMNPSPVLSTLSPGSSGLSNAQTPARPSSNSSTGSRGSCSSAGRGGAGSGASAEQVKVKKEPGTEDSYSCPSSSLKTERGADARRSACMMSSPESSPLEAASAGHDTLRVHGERIKTEPESDTPCSGLNGASTMTPSTSTASTNTSAIKNSYRQSDLPLTNGNVDKSSSRASEAAGGSVGKEDDPNEDWCAVCINGGNLLCCDHCPKVFHMKCHVPTIKIFPKGDFLCTFCRSIANPEIEYCDESRRLKEDQSLTAEDQRKCERVLLYVFCHELSVGFREPVPSSVPNYYKIIKQPMDLKRVKRKLQLRSSQYYKSIQEFVQDMRLVFKNCSTYNEMSRIIQVYDEEKEINTQVGSEMAISGKAVSLYFEEKLAAIFPDQNFPDTPEPESPDEKEKEDEDTEDSEEEFIQPRRKRLKMDDKIVHVK